MKETLDEIVSLEERQAERRLYYENRLAEQMESKSEEKETEK